MGNGARAGSIRDINPSGCMKNCVNCAIAMDATLAGRPACALLGGFCRIDVLEKMFGSKFGISGDISQIIEALLTAGSGSRGIVFGVRAIGIGHVFNAVNQHGTIRFLDGQTGRLAVIGGFVEFRFLRTN